jgi:hypothetical protein
MANQLESSPGAGDESGSSIWVWQILSTYNVACLSGAALHLRLNILTAMGKNKIVQALKDGFPPETAISRKRIEISLASIRELCFSEKAEVLEIFCGAKSPVVVYGSRPSGVREMYNTLRKKSSIKEVVQEVLFEPSVAREIYDALRQRIASGVAPTAGTLQARNAINSPVIGLCLTVLGGGAAIYESTLPPNPHLNWLREGPKEWFRQMLTMIGTWNLVAIVLALAAFFTWWLIYRLSHPHKAEVIVLTQPLRETGSTPEVS